MTVADASKLKWQEAELSHLQGLDLHSLLATSTSAEPNDYGRLFTIVLEDEAFPALNRPAIEMLRAIIWMHASEDADRPPFGPMFQAANGNRSAAPDDFSGPILDVVVQCLEMTSHPVITARLAHLVWFLERRRREVGLKALASYIEILKQLDLGTLNSDGDATALSIFGHELICIAFNVSRGLGYPEPEETWLRQLAEDLFERACSSDEIWAVMRFGELGLQRGRCDPVSVAQKLEAFILSLEGSGQERQLSDIWLLASEAYQRAKLPLEAQRCQEQAAEGYVGLAEGFFLEKRSSSIAAHWMSHAIGIYHGHPNAKTRRAELRQRLIEMQAGIADEVMPFSHSTNITEMVTACREHFTKLDLPNALLHFTTFKGPPEPEELQEQARQDTANFPLSAMFPKTFMDADGKTVATSPGSEVGLNGPSGDFRPQIAQNEAIRRGFAVRGEIEIARQTIALQHRISRMQMYELLKCSPAVPPRLLRTTVEGFLRYFDGDMVAAVYILTPLVEGVLRHMLKSFGHDVSTLDNATGTQEDRTITSLYDAMRPELDAIFGEALTDDIDRVFLSKIGPSLRHGVAHALLSDSTPYSDDANYACWLIWRLVVFPLVPHWDDIFKTYLSKTSSPYEQEAV